MAKQISDRTVYILEDELISDHDESDYNELDAKRLDQIYRKLDLRVIPPLWCLYFLTSFGSAAFGVALTMNMSEGHSLIQKLDLSNHDTSTASALDFVGYIVFDLPANLVMTRMAPQSWISRIVISVGIVYACFAAISSPPGLIVARLMSGICTAGIWPGMAYYISLWYPSHRTARRIGYYFTAAQISAAVAGLVSAGFQQMDGNRGLTGYQWMFLVYGVITATVGISLNWWLPDRPFENRQEPINGFAKFLGRLVVKMPHPLNEEERALHARDMAERYSKPQMWGLRELWTVFKDIRIWPLIMMYFGVVGAGYGLMVAATTILHNINPNLSSIDLSLLVAPIWLFDLAAIVIVTPLSDKFKRHRGLVFSLSAVIIIVGLFVTTFSKPKWARYGGLLICGFGLGPTVPICMTWAAEIFGPRHGDLGTAASAALVSGLGNLGSVTTTYALYNGWPSDALRGYRNSNMVMVGILGFSIVSSGACTLVRAVSGDLEEEKRPVQSDV